MLADSIGNRIPIEQLLREEAFPHEVSGIELLETHISWVLLTGAFAYKIKKPVKFDFVDYSTPEKRKHFCDLEVELNRRYAPDLYLGVVPILETEDGLQIGDDQWIQLPVTKLPLPTVPSEQPTSRLEYAVKMKQFPQSAVVAARLENPALTTQAVEDFGRYLAEFHGQIEAAIPTDDFANPASISESALDNFTALEDPLAGDPRFELLESLQHWTVSQLNSLVPKFEKRLKSGFVRRCHGDLHLKNMIQLDGRISPFDGIEFNEEFQWIDVLSEIAFPVMDFIARGRPDLGWSLLNSYLESTGDYASLDILRFYLVYRAMVRAKVAWLNPKNQTAERRQESGSGAAATDAHPGPWDKYLRAAEFFAFQLRPKLNITHGFSGSGKSTVAMKLIRENGGIRIRSDAERHRLADKFKTKDKYSSPMNDWVYTHLLELASIGLESGFPMTIDATFLKFKNRQPFLELAKRLQCEFAVIECDATYDQLCDRIRTRGPDPSEATIEVLTMQMETHDPLTTEELQLVIRENVN